MGSWVWTPYALDIIVAVVDAAGIPQLMDALPDKNPFSMYPHLEASSHRPSFWRCVAVKSKTMKAGPGFTLTRRPRLSSLTFR